MRALRFRAWNGEGFISPDYIDREGVAHWKENSVPQASGDVEQYTGLTDDEGKEVYEGDIVEVYPYGGDVTEEERVVAWNDGGFWAAQIGECKCDILEGFGTFDGFRIIGNIHEDVELAGEILRGHDTGGKP